MTAPSCGGKGGGFPITLWALSPAYLFTENSLIYPLLNVYHVILLESCPKNVHSMLEHQYLSHS